MIKTISLNKINSITVENNTLAINEKDIYTIAIPDTAVWKQDFQASIFCNKAFTSPVVINELGAYVSCHNVQLFEHEDENEITFKLNVSTAGYRELRFSVRDINNNVSEYISANIRITK